MNDLPAFRLVDGTVVDLGRADIYDMVKNLKEGEFITLGRSPNCDLLISNSSNISRHHILITKQNGKIQFKDVSRYASTKAMSRAEVELRNNAIRKFDKNQAYAEVPYQSDIDPRENYVLDYTNLPKLRLYDGTIIDLSSQKYYNAIRHLQEGKFITLGRTGHADIGISDSLAISRHHILLTIQDGQLILKDISLNGGTYSIGNSNNDYSNARNSKNYQRRDYSGRGERSGRAYGAEASSSNNSNKISEYRKILDISENTPLTKSVIKEAFRKKSLECHPDRHPGEEDEYNVIMAKINEAEDELNKYVENSNRAT